MRLIVGLGNPGKNYEDTFHNMGFHAADRIAAETGASFSKKQGRAKVAEYRIEIAASPAAPRNDAPRSERVLLAKPQTMMNLSGGSVLALASFYKIPPANILVIYDDIDLPRGVLRVRGSGTAGTHNGMKDIVQKLGTEFPRLRIGIGRPPEHVPLVDYVLYHMDKGAKAVLNESCSSAAEAALEWARGETVENLMQRYN